MTTPHPPHILAFDLGGANLKVANGLGHAASYPFALWQEFANLPEKLREIIRLSPPCEQLAVTMTGELADCFATKAEGVRFILNAVQNAAEHRNIHVYMCNGRFVSLNVAMQSPQLAAAANWHALAKFAARFNRDETDVASLLIDIGSTTTDLIPIVAGKVVARGTTDTTRLLQHELVYTGVERTPVCALVSELPYRGERCPIAREYFATTYDVYLLLHDLPENPHDCRTADHRPATCRPAEIRLGRMIAADETECNAHDALAIATEIANAQTALLVHAAQQVLSRFNGPPQSYILAGQGEFLARRVLEHLPPVRRIVSLSRELGPLISQCAPAHAVAILAREELQT